MDSELSEWFDTRPKNIKKLFLEYPPGEYMIKKGAPYAISSEGTVVYLESYLVSGEVGVIILAEEKTESAINHEKKLGVLYNHANEYIKDINNSNIKVFVDPKWLLPLD